MENLRKFLFFALLASTATFSTGSETSSTKYDITTLLNNSITRSFQYMDSDFIKALFLSIENLNTTTFEKTAECESAPFENKFYFTGIKITTLHSPFTIVRRSFPFDLLTLQSEKLVIRIDAYLGATNDTVHVGFSRFVDFEDCSMMISRRMHTERLFDIYLMFENYTSHYANPPSFHPDIEPDSRLKLEKQIDKLLPRILRDSLLKNERFCHLLHSAFITHPKKEINSTYTDFANNNHQYHYFIPNFTSLRRTLSNITLTGLSNFENHGFCTSLGRPISTLQIRNIGGKANLFYDSPNSTIFPLQFKISCLTIELDREKQLVDVRTDDYSVNETKSNESLNEYQSKWIMEGIQLAIASSIMPSIRVYRHRNQSTSTNGQHPIKKIITTMSHLFRENVVQKFNATRNTSLPKMKRIESNLEIESSQYNISIDTNEQALMSFRRIHGIGCDPYDHLTILFDTKTNSSLEGKIMLRNNTHFLDDIDFAVGRVMVHLFKRNNLNENDDYESSTDIFSIFLGKQHTFEESQLTIIKKKVEEMLALPIAKILLPYTKFLLSSTLDYCTSPVKMFDDFLPFYADYELPYKVPNIDNTTNSEERFASKVRNVVISEWEHNIEVLVFPLSEDEDRVEPTVSLKLESVKITLNDNQAAYKFKELEVRNEELWLDNGTHFNGKIEANFREFYPQFLVAATYEFLPRSECVMLRYRLQYLIGKSFD